MLLDEWLISVPVWGDKYRKLFVEVAVPALRAALADFPRPVRFLIHTDRPDQMREALTGFRVDTHEIPVASTYVALQAAHGDAIAKAAVGQKVVLLNADLIVSRNLFKSCLYHFRTGKRAVVTTGIRTAPDGAPVPIGAEPRALLEWAWDHRHQIIRDLEWGTGTSMLPTNLFFIQGDSVILHGFHLHPVAIVKERELSFISTIDGDLLEHFERDQIHVVTSPDDLSMLEISDPARRFPVRDHPVTASQVAASMVSRASGLHRWLFTFRIVIRGNGDDESDRATAVDILQILENHKPLPKPPEVKPYVPVSQAEQRRLLREAQRRGRR